MSELEIKISIPEHKFDGWDLLHDFGMDGVKAAMEQSARDWLRSEGIRDVELNIEISTEEV
jgi:hypothetical protein